MKHSFTQSELQTFVDKGEFIVLSYRSAAQILFSNGTREFYLSPLKEKANDLPFTKKGRIQVVTPDYFQKILIN